MPKLRRLLAGCRTRCDLYLRPKRKGTRQPKSSSQKYLVFNWPKRRLRMKPSSTKFEGFQTCFALSARVITFRENRTGALFSFFGQRSDNETLRLASTALCISRLLSSTALVARHGCWRPRECRRMRNTQANNSQRHGAFGQQWDFHVSSAYSTF